MDTDYSPLINELVKIGALILTLAGAAAASYLTMWLRSKGLLTDKNVEAAIQQNFNEVMLIGVSLLESYLKVSGDSHVDWATVRIDNPFLRQVADWVIRTWPEKVKGMSLEDVIKSLFARIPSGPASEKLQSIVEAKAAAPKI